MLNKIQIANNSYLLWYDGSFDEECKMVEPMSALPNIETNLSIQNINLKKAVEEMKFRVNVIRELLISKLDTKIKMINDKKDFDRMQKKK